MHSPRIIHLSADGTSLILIQNADDLPVAAHWGAALSAEDDDLTTIFTSSRRRGLGGVSDLPYEPSLLPEHDKGWFGRPGVAMHRAGSAWSPRWRVQDVTLDGKTLPGGVTQAGPGSVVVTATDDWAQVELVLEIDLTPSGLVRARARVTNRSTSGDPLDVQSVSIALPVPTTADEMLDFAGRWGHERMPRRIPITAGVKARESRRGRTGLDSTLVVVAGARGFTARDGEVWMGHAAIGGNHEHALERTDGHLTIRAGEMLFPGEVRLAAHESYEAPWVYGSYGVGLDRAAQRFHGHLRGVSRSSRRPRPVTLNVWEAVYFDQDHDSLVALARTAAAIGVERYVLDDGWFVGRRDDRKGLGDWSPDPDVWPRGLRPLADEVRNLGMEFGLWVEPEMINEDSDLARAHPDWILRARPELPMLYRHQQVLDLTNPEAYKHILDTLSGLVDDIGVTYLKWDHNRDLVSAGHPVSGKPAGHAQTLALYRLLDELRERHPDLEIESCASGGGRVDLGILERTDRVHTSDSHDPQDRVRMLRWTGMLVPPEMLGSHVASATSSVTGRTHTLDFRCAVAFLGHFGIEWDISELDDDDLTILSRWIADYTRHRDLIQTGTVVGDGDFDDDGPSLRGVVAPDRAEALYTVVTPQDSADTMARLRLPGLDPAKRYRITARGPASIAPPWHTPEWLREPDSLSTGEGPVLSGSFLTARGLDVPTFHPDRALLVRAVSLDEEAS